MYTVSYLRVSIEHFFYGNNKGKTCTPLTPPKRGRRTRGGREEKRGRSRRKTGRRRGEREGGEEREG